MPLTPFQKRKLQRMFSTFDLNGDGLVERADYLRRVEAVASRRGWSPHAPEYARNREFALYEWQALCESADRNADGAVTRDEYVRWGEIFLDDRDAVRAYARGDVQLLFDAMDLDGDGLISADEYRAYLEVCGVDATGSDALFAHADVDENGRITRAEMAHAFEEFLLGEHPGAGGNSLFGPLESP